MTRRDKNNKHRYPCLFPGSSTTGSSGPATYIQCHAVPFLSWIKSAWGRALFFHESLGPWSLVPLQLCWPSCSTVPSRTKTTWDTASWVNITHCNFAPAFLDPTWGAYVRFWATEWRGEAALLRALSRIPPFGRHCFGIWVQCLGYGCD